jgi:hypothetical protein
VAGAGLAATTGLALAGHPVWAAAGLGAAVAVVAAAWGLRRLRARATAPAAAAAENNSTPRWVVDVPQDALWQPADLLPPNPALAPEDPEIGEHRMRSFVLDQPSADAAAEPDTAAPALALVGPSGLPTLTLEVNIEKVADCGEDAEPLVRIGQSGAAWVGVFDGVGGAGKRRYPVKEGEWTGARVASRTARHAVVGWIGSHGQYLRPEESGGVLFEVDGLVRQALKQVEGRFPDSGPVITGTAIRSLPTTVALGLVESVDAQTGRVRVFWAGDSRVYLLSPVQGLVPLTTDHVVEPDPDSRTSDSPMTNMASAGSPFYIEERSYKGPFPVIAFAATDGCFEYFRSPVLFERMMLATMAAAPSMDEWSHALCAALDSVASDDCTMGLAAIGWADFDAVKTAFRKRLAYLEKLAAEIDRFDADIRAHQGVIDSHRAVIDANQAEIDRLREERRQRAAAQWANYREDYVITAAGRRSR